MSDTPSIMNKDSKPVLEKPKKIDPFLTIIDQAIEMNSKNESDAKERIQIKLAKVKRLWLNPSLSL